MYEGVGQQLAGLLQVVAVLDGVGQDTRQQAHVLALGLDVSWFEQWQVGEHEGDDALLGLTLPLTDHPWKCSKNNRMSTTVQMKALELI